MGNKHMVEVKEHWAPYYDEYMDVWNVKECSTGLMYPMTGEPMAKQISGLLNYYDKRLHNVLDELYVKDRRLEELGAGIDV